MAELETSSSITAASVSDRVMTTVHAQGDHGGFQVRKEPIDQRAESFVLGLWR